MLGPEDAAGLVGRLAIVVLGGCMLALVARDVPLVGQRDDPVGMI
jgi:hypothetical protein